MLLAGPAPARGEFEVAAVKAHLSGQEPPPMKQSVVSVEGAAVTPVS